MVRLLVCDGAPQFTWVTLELALCWVHEGGHYNLNEPFTAFHNGSETEFL